MHEIVLLADLPAFPLLLLSDFGLIRERHCIPVHIVITHMVLFRLHLVPVWTPILGTVRRLLFHKLE